MNEYCDSVQPNEAPLWGIGFGSSQFCYSLEQMEYIAKLAALNGCSISRIMVALPEPAGPFNGIQKSCFDNTCMVLELIEKVIRVCNGETGIFPEEFNDRILKSHKSV
jgi:hypothetical protein